MAEGTQTKFIYMKNAKRKFARKYFRMPYYEQYVEEEDPAFRYRLKECFEVIIHYQETRKAAFWATCCQTFIRSIKTEEIDHPSSSLIPLRRLILQNDLTTAEKLKTFFKRELMRNTEGMLRMPGINMIHGHLDLIQEKDLQGPGLQQPEDPILKVQAEIDELSSMRKLRDQMAEMKALVNP